jgi:putative transposase
MRVGSTASLQGRTHEWRSALDRAVNSQFPAGARGHGRSLMREHGCQPTSVGLMRACGTLGIQYALTSLNNPQGHAATERLMRTLKEECLWRREWTGPFAMVESLEQWIADDNAHDLHSALGYKTPRQVERGYQGGRSTPFAHA